MPLQRRPFLSGQDPAHCRGHIRFTPRGDDVVCLECGGCFRDLAKHLCRHELTTADYREKWGYNRQTALLVPSLHEDLRQRALRQHLSALSPPDAMQKAAKARRATFSPLRRERRLATGATTKARLAAGWRPGEKLKQVADDTLRALVAAGLTVQAVAGRTGLHYSTAWERIRALYLVGPRLRRKPSPIPPAQLLAFREGGLSAREIAARTGKTASAVRAAPVRLRRRGLLPVR